MYYGQKNIVELFKNTFYCARFGKIIDAKITSDEIIFTFENKDKIHFLHEQDCCESVGLITECLDELTAANFIGDTLNCIEVASNDELEKEFAQKEGDSHDSYTWTFYNLRFKNAGYFQLRWFGESNGYYSESVSVYHIKNEESDASN